MLESARPCNNEPVLDALEHLPPVHVLGVHLLQDRVGRDDDRSGHKAALEREGYPPPCDGRGELERDGGRGSG